MYDIILVGTVVADVRYCVSVTPTTPGGPPPGF